MKNNYQIDNGFYDKMMIIKFDDDSRAGQQLDEGAAERAVRATGLRQGRPAGEPSRRPE